MYIVNQIDNQFGYPIYWKWKWRWKWI